MVNGRVPCIHTPLISDVDQGQPFWANVLYEFINQLVARVDFGLTPPISNQPSGSDRHSSDDVTLPKIHEVGRRLCFVRVPVVASN